MVDHRYNGVQFKTDVSWEGLLEMPLKPSNVSPVTVVLRFLEANPRSIADQVKDAEAAYHALDLAEGDPNA